MSFENPEILPPEPKASKKASLSGVQITRKDRLLTSGSPETGLVHVPREKGAILLPPPPSNKLLRGGKPAVHIGQLAAAAAGIAAIQLARQQKDRAPKKDALVVDTVLNGEYLPETGRTVRAKTPPPLPILEGEIVDGDKSLVLANKDTQLATIPPLSPTQGPKKKEEPLQTASELVEGKGPTAPDRIRPPQQPVLRGQVGVNPPGNINFHHPVERADEFATQHNHLETTAAHGNMVQGHVRNIGSAVADGFATKKYKQDLEKYLDNQDKWQDFNNENAADALKREADRDKLNKQHIEQMAAFMTSVGKGGTPASAAPQQQAYVRP